MRNFILGFALGVVVIGGFAYAQNDNRDFYGRPQFGNQVTPPYDFYGRPNFPQQPNLLPQHLQHPC